jgi:hypothetical protein
MKTQTRALPPLPGINHPESYYAKLAHEAEQSGDLHAHEAAKVAQYITLGLDSALPWEEKVKYFRHAVRRHCVAPPFCEEDVARFYERLAGLVRQHAGQEALRIASEHDDMFAARLSMGQDREAIEDEAEELFVKLMGSGDECPEWFPEEDWAQLRMLRDQWI